MFSLERFNNVWSVRPMANRIKDVSRGNHIFLVLVFKRSVGLSFTIKVHRHWCFYHHSASQVLIEICHKAQALVILWFKNEHQPLYTDLANTAWPWCRQWPDTKTVKHQENSQQFCSLSQHLKALCSHWKYFWNERQKMHIMSVRMRVGGTGKAGFEQWLSWGNKRSSTR